jgi:hypothetical protein
MSCASATDHGKPFMSTPFSPPASTKQGNRHEHHARAVRSRKPRPEPLPHAFGYTIDDACCMTGVGRTKLYSIIAEGKLQVSRAAGRTIVLGDSLRALLATDAV